MRLCILVMNPAVLATLGWRARDKSYESNLQAPCWQAHIVSAYAVPLLVFVKMALTRCLRP